MARKGILEQIDARANQLSAAAAAPASPVHAATVEVMTELVNLGRQMSGTDTPPMMRAMLRMVESCRPMMLDGLGRIPPDQIKAFMRELRGKIDLIIDAPG